MSSRDELIWFDVDVFADAIDSACDDTRGIIEKAIYSTMAKARRRARTMMSGLIREKWNIQKKHLDGKIRIKAGSRSKIYESFEMTVKGVSLSLSYFGAKQYSGRRVISRTVGRTNKYRSKFQGVQVTVLKGKRTRLTNAFIQAAGTGHMMVLRRTSKARYPIEEKAVISPASMFESHETADRFEEDMMEFIEKTFAHEVEWRLQQAWLA